MEEEERRDGPGEEIMDEHLQECYYRMDASKKYGWIDAWMAARIGFFTGGQDTQRSAGDGERVDLCLHPPQELHRFLQRPGQLLPVLDQHLMVRLLDHTHTRAQESPLVSSKVQAMPRRTLKENVYSKIGQGAQP
jgi:hypothetical protein